MEKGSKVFYGWVVVAAGFLIYGFPMQLASTFSSYYQVPVCTELNAPYTIFSLASMAGAIGGMLFSFFLSSKLAQGNTRRWMMVGGAAAGVSVFCMGFISSIAHLAVLQFITGFSFSCMTYVPVNVMINHWFIAKRGTATSISLMGQGVGSIILTPLISPVIKADWRMAYRLEGVLILLLSLTLPLLMRKPEELGASPLRENGEGEDGSADREREAWPGVTKSQAVRSVSMALYALVCLCCGLVASGVVTQLPTFFVENGHAFETGMMVYSGVHIVGPLVVGWLFDRLEILRGTAVSGGMLVVSMALWIFLPGSMIACCAGTAIFAVSCCICTLLPPLACSKIFGQREYGGIYGFGNFFFSAGALLGTLLATGIRDLTGNYRATWVFMALLVVIQVLSTAAAVKSRSRLVAQYPG